MAGVAGVAEVVIAVLNSFAETIQVEIGERIGFDETLDFFQTVVGSD